MTARLTRLLAGELQREPAHVEVARRLFGRAGFHLLSKHYYQPVPDLDELPPSIWERTSELAGVTLGEDRALALLEDVFPTFFSEFRQRFSDEPSSEEAFHLINGTFMAVDAHVLYAFVRHLNPRHVLELGSGMSTLVAAAALEANGRSVRVTSVDPYPPTYVDNASSLAELVRRRAEDLPLATYLALEPGDILFIDSTHVLRLGGDVQFLYLEVLPRLAPGVYVHVHDVSLPREYPRAYAEQGLFWNEQYLLQAFLAFNSRFEILWPGNALMLRWPDRMLAAFPEIEGMRQVYPSSEPTSFWMRVRDAE